MVLAVAARAPRLRSLAILLGDEDFRVLIFRGDPPPNRDDRGKPVGEPGFVRLDGDDYFWRRAFPGFGIDEMIGGGGGAEPLAAAA